MKASECSCIVCGKPAVAFWPIIDPDIPEHPCCRKCLNQAKIEMLSKVFAYDKSSARVIIKTFNKKRDLQ